MKIEILVAAVHQDVRLLAQKMKIQTDAIIINQCDRFGVDEFELDGSRVRAFSFAEKGVGLNRNNALMRSDSDICLFSDEDIVLCSGYKTIIEQEFVNHPGADLIMFNLEVDERRATYHNTSFKRVRWYNYGRYPTYSIAARVDRLRYANVSFSLLFGGGARYSNGEDSLFLHDCLQKGLKLYASPRYIGAETYRASTWFHGYDAKFFIDRGVLYHYLYGRWAALFSWRFLWAHKQEICAEIKPGEAYKLMRQGIREG
ncbi:MAG: glycosyltransferase family 2 protein, partial [Lachnospiraceae bacterium]|nr:glycosyltransferase family 2 protein [Lachnospiraceae bacterium]